MSRKIEFRGIAKEGPMKGKFVYGACFYSELREKTYIIDKHEDWIEVHPDTVGQCTDHSDENDNNIFEGDILESIFGNRYIVIWDDPNTSFRFIKIGTDLQYYFSGYSLVCIGNIHQNKELLR